MRKQPTGRALLGIAAATEAALTAHPDDTAANYKTAMIKNARAIAERQAAAGTMPEKMEQEALEKMLGVHGNLPDLNQQLVQAIRAGIPPSGTHDHLTQTVRRELAESNPRYLEKVDGDC